MFVYIFYLLKFMCYTDMSCKSELIGQILLPKSKQLIFYHFTSYCKLWTFNSKIRSWQMLLMHHIIFIFCLATTGMLLSLDKPTPTSHITTDLWRSNTSRGQCTTATPLPRGARKSPSSVIAMQGGGPLYLWMKGRPPVGPIHSPGTQSMPVLAVR